MSKVSVLRDAGTEELTGNERRRFDRADCTIRVDYGSVDELFSEFTRDINEGGLFIETDSPLELGSRVGLQFTLPESAETFHATGTVMWVRPRVDESTGEPIGMGVEFDELDAEERSKINELVRSLRA